MFLLKTVAVAVTVRQILVTTTYDSLVYPLKEDLSEMENPMQEQGRSIRASHVVLVHGAWHGAAHWQPLVDLLAEADREVSAIDLPGHGLKATLGTGEYAGNSGKFAVTRSYAADIGIDDAAYVVVNALRALPHGSQPIVVAHSIGGMVVSRATEIAPELVGRLVYLAAFMPTARSSAAAYAALPEFQTGYGALLHGPEPSEGVSPQSRWVNGGW